MPTAAKPTENMSKHLTQAEREVREEAEAAVLPDRGREAKLDALTGKLQALERNIIQYAEKLGLTPSGRVRLAQKRAAAASEQADDLFGD